MTARRAETSPAWTDGEDADRFPAEGFGAPLDRTEGQRAIAAIAKDVALASDKFGALRESAIKVRARFDAGEILISLSDLAESIWSVADRNDLRDEPGGEEKITEIERAAAYQIRADAVEVPRNSNPAQALQLRAFPKPWWSDPATIPPRRTLYDGHYIRKSIGVSVAAGGRLKTTYGIYEAVSMSVGFDLATKVELPAGKLRVWVCNGEEPQEELDRRVAAACQLYGITKADLGGRLYVQSVRDNPLRLAILKGNRPEIDKDVLRYMRDFIEANRIDAFLIDPLVSFHGVVENDNMHMDMLIKEGFGSIANSTNSAGEVFHHIGKPKPGGLDATVEDGRGASAVLAAGRSARVFNFMSPAEAKNFGISEDDRRLHVRITNGKANMGPIGKAKWIKTTVETLVNGDRIACVSPWEPPNHFDGITTADMQVARQLAQTGAYRSDSRSPEWFGYALAAQLKLEITPEGDNDKNIVAKVKGIMKTWLKNKVLDIEERDDEQRKKRKFIIPGSFKSEPNGNDEQDCLDVE